MSGNGNIREVQEKLGGLSGVSVVAGNGGLPTVNIANRHAEATIYLHGAHVTHFQPRAQAPVLWMSCKSIFEAGKPIRGGVPICWPWFGTRADDASLPGHGFARRMEWELSSANVDAEGRTTLVLTLCDSAETRKLWPHAFALTFTVTVGAALEMSLATTNTGKDAFIFTEALHSYLTVGDIHRASVSGLEGTTYIDTLQKNLRIKQDNSPITFAGETDRLYVDTTTACIVEDTVMNRRLRIAKTGSLSTVVWNPWINKSKAMPDFGDDEWPGMLCVETVNAADNAVTVPPGQTHEMSAKIEVP